MENVRAYGAGLAGGTFDWNTYLRKPTVIFRILGVILGALLWFSISKGGWHRQSENHHQICLYGGSSSTCSFASALGFFALASGGCLLMSDAKFEKISSIPSRKKIVMADLATSAGFFFCYIIGFFLLWSKYGGLEIEGEYKTGYVRFGILLSFLSSLAWGGATFFAWRRYAEGAATAFDQTYQNDFGGISSDVQEGYGYGGDSDGIGSVGGAMSVGNTSYQAGAPPTVIPNPPANPFVGSDGYGY